MPKIDDLQEIVGKDDPAFDKGMTPTVTGSVVSIKAGASRRGYHRPFWGIVVVAPDYQGKDVAFWFTRNDDALASDNLHIGDEVTITGKITGITPDGGMRFMHEVAVASTAVCEHPSLTMMMDEQVVSRKRWVCNVCEGEFNLRRWEPPVKDKGSFVKPTMA